ncbi:hypothetical protein BJ875DRAFT_437980 [Amylocarpus encephaloides]|uniref:Uncharacterized protein n=1 Tax=Amylocarpus encephaloides TaxID=45428 RepID=A0A9P7YQL1_9HELO|nr:hypothetical protein BJ875DRAFT_437980 [Amylocarpus encephaloides]
MIRSSGGEEGKLPPVLRSGNYYSTVTPPGHLQLKNRARAGLSGDRIKSMQKKGAGHGGSINEEQVNYNLLRSLLVSLPIVSWSLGVLEMHQSAWSKNSSMLGQTVRLQGSRAFQGAASWASLHGLITSGTLHMNHDVHITLGFKPNRFNDRGLALDHLVGRPCSYDKFDSTTVRPDDLTRLLRAIREEMNPMIDIPSTSQSHHLPMAAIDESNPLMPWPHLASPEPSIGAGELELSDTSTLHTVSTASVNHTKSRSGSAASPLSQSFRELILIIHVPSILKLSMPWPLSPHPRLIPTQWVAVALIDLSHYNAIATFLRSCPLLSTGCPRFSSGGNSPFALSATQKLATPLVVDDRVAVRMSNLNVGNIFTQFGYLVEATTKTCDDSDGAIEK